MYFTFTRKPLRGSYSGRMSIILMDSYRSNESGELKNSCLDCICSVKFISISPSWRAGEQAKGQIDTANKIGLRFLSLRRGLIVMETFFALKCLLHVCVLGETGEGRKVREGWGVEGEVRGVGWRKDRVTDGKITKVPTGCGRLTCMFWFWWLIATQPSSDVQEVMWGTTSAAPHHRSPGGEEAGGGGGGLERERERERERRKRERERERERDPAIVFVL